MNFQTAIQTCLSKYVDFSGRARRSEYWYFALFSFLISFVTLIVDRAIGTDWENGGLLNSVAGLALLLPSLAVGARRLHDTGRSGWLLLLVLIPLLGVIVLIVFFVQDSKADNTYGPNPKTGGAGGYPPPPAAPYGSGQYGG